MEVMVLAVKAEGVKIGYIDEEDRVQWAVRGVDLEIGSGDSFCIVGESGSGKTTLANAIAGILPPHAIIQGRLIIDGKLVLDNGRLDFNGVRGRIVSYIPQNPGTSLNPFMTVEEHFYYILRDTKSLSRKEARRIALESLMKVGLDQSVLEMYPHELSGGMQQRVTIAIAIASRPKIIIADEPTSSVDANLRAGILKLLNRLNRELGLTLIMVTHDIYSAAAVCSKVAVMLVGKIVEMGEVKALLYDPRHPYTRILLNCVPVLGVKKPLKPLVGEPPRLYSDIKHCPFLDRCPFAVETCKVEPLLEPVDGKEDHVVRCWRFKELKSVEL
jgi:peptide/nickel transport system ATP-binding protein